MSRSGCECLIPARGRGRKLGFSTATEEVLLLLLLFEDDDEDDRETVVRVQKSDK
jgi:hypothetical protein